MVSASEAGLEPGKTPDRTLGMVYLLMHLATNSPWYQRQSVRAPNIFAEQTYWLKRRRISHSFQGLSYNILSYNFSERCNCVIW